MVCGGLSYSHTGDETSDPASHSLTSATDHGGSPSSSFTRLSVVIVSLATVVTVSVFSPAAELGILGLDIRRWEFALDIIPAKQTFANQHNVT